MGKVVDMQAWREERKRKAERNNPTPIPTKNTWIVDNATKFHKFVPMENVPWGTPIPEGFDVTAKLGDNYWINKVIEHVNAAEASREEAKHFESTHMREYCAIQSQELIEKAWAYAKYIKGKFMYSTENYCISVNEDSE